MFPELYIASGNEHLIRVEQTKTEVFIASREETASFLETGISKGHGVFSLT